MREARLAAVRKDWHKVLVAVAERERVDQAAIIERWEPKVVALRAETIGLQRKGAWVSGPPDGMGVLKLSRAGIRHSAMLAWRFDPIGAHGLGERMLRSVMDRCFGEEEHGPIGAPRVECEVARLDCRADIVAWTES